MNTILVVDDEAPFRAVIREILEPLGHRIVEAGDGEEALERLARLRVDLVIADQRMPRLGGLELLRRIRMMPAPPPLVLLTAYGTIPDAVDAVRAGAIDYLSKPLESPDELIAVVERVLAVKDDDEIAGESRRLREVVDTADRVAGKDVPVLITGESGTGKELVARRIHGRSGRAKKPFVAINCAALPESLAESELFGHERGAFTGAERQRLGRFEEASGGTLFLDEVGELSAAAQGKLLRALEERVIRRVGAARDIPVDIRLIAATNRDLSNGGFRSDLYFRLAVVRLEIPPLRERPDDIPIVAQHLLARLARKHGMVMPQFSTDAVHALRRHPWPGNVRELRNVLERALILRAGEPIRESDLALAPMSPSLATTRDEAEKERVLQALRQAHGNRETAAKFLGVSVRTLYYRLNRLGLA
jgi:DNA-binding NtrC family response regulator